MSVTSLKTTNINLYSVTNTRDVYGSYKTSYTIKYSNIPARICYRMGFETVENGKEIIVPEFLVMIGPLIDIIETDLIVDLSDNSQYDAVWVNQSYDRHREVQCKKVDQIITNLV